MWRGEYYANRFLSGAPAYVRNDPAIDFNWGFTSPAPGIPPSEFSVRWSQTVFFSEGTYRFFARADDGVRIWVDNQLILDEWHSVDTRTYSADKALTNGWHFIVVDFFQYGGPANISVWWEHIQPSPSFPDWKGEYFANRHLSGAPGYVRNDRAIDFDWSYRSPAPGIPSENFSVRWTRTQEFSGGHYRFYARRRWNPRLGRRPPDHRPMA
ncbi:MAG: hypothetical protein IPK16_15885 [Anaerolineales bacterium]|nr:hypothetical protein [Anaerolineales bacterium]